LCPQIARAALVADAKNYPYVRAVITVFRAKYSQYEPSEAVKAELAKAVKDYEEMP
jgi:hypothetical protein